MKRSPARNGGASLFSTLHQPFRNGLQNQSFSGIFGNTNFPGEVSFMPMRFRLIFFLVFAFCQSTFGGTKGLRVYIFLSETCPICQSVTSELKKLHQQFGPLQVEFIGLFPDGILSDAQTRAAFGKKYGLSFPLLADSGQLITRKFNAEITPEVVVVNNETEAILYRGKVDNSYASLGKRRTVVTEHYLRQALESWMAGKNILLSETQPVGCIIQKK
jgi:peroxiredoxin